MSNSKKQGYGRKPLADEVGFIGFKLASFEKEEFAELCEKKVMPVSERLQLLIARDLYHEKQNEKVQDV